MECVDIDKDVDSFVYCHVENCDNFKYSILCSGENLNLIKDLDFIGNLRISIEK